MSGPSVSPITLFIPCLTDQFYPDTGMNMVRVLERLGFPVTYDARQTCCGQPAFNTGYHDEAASLACRFLDLFADAEIIVAPSGSCATMVKVFYGDLLTLPREYRDRAEAMRGRIFEFTEFLVDVARITDVGARYAATVTVHDSCHALRELGIKQQPRLLLEQVRDCRVVEMEDAERCCGFGGTFAVKQAGLSSGMVEAKVAAILASGADVVTGVDSSCLMNIEGHLHRKGSSVRALHIADILARED